jgi:cytochrome c
MSKLIPLFFAMCILSLVASSAQQSSSKPVPAPIAPIPVDAAKQANPVKPTPESIAHGKKWWTIDCAVCHGAEGNGKGDVAKDMKLDLPDFTDPATFKDRTDGEIFYLIKNGHDRMPPEGPRVKPEENWDLVNYVRSLAKPKDDALKP